MIVYVCSPYSGEIRKNTIKAREYCRFVVEEGNVPIAPHLLLPQFMDEQKERELAIAIDMSILDRCDEVWVFGGVMSAGMRAEIAYAKNKHKKVRYFTEAGRTK